jgi:glucose/arabinose dehydrogenase
MSGRQRSRSILATAIGVFLGCQAPWSQSVTGLGDGPWNLETSGPRTKIRVSVVTRGLSHPWSVTFLPDGDMLVTEREGRLRLVHNGVLDPEPIAGVPAVRAAFLVGLLDVALHPEFEQNGYVYLTYSKPGEKGSTTALARGTLKRRKLVDLHDVFVADAWSKSNTNPGSRLVWAPDGTLYMTIGDRGEAARAQNPLDHVGKIVRLRDDGTVPADNPFVGKAGYRPEIYSYGHRSPEGLVVHQQTGAVWETEQGPNGGDEANIILGGRNYGWPLVSYGRDYGGPRISEHAWSQGIDEPVLVWVPSIATSGATFYTGDRFPEWKGNLFVGALRMGEINGTGHLQRIVLNERGEELRREILLSDLKQRIRDVRQGPDGLLYVLTDEEQGALLRIEPAHAAS